MLLKTNVTPYSLPSPDWNTARLARFTSSENHLLMAPEGIGKTGMKYIYRKVGEELSGMPAREDITTAATSHGNQYEIEGVKKFCDKMGIIDIDGHVPIIQRFVSSGERFGSTPDGIWVLKESIDQTEYDVCSIEIKCPFSFDAYINLWKCETPADVRKTDFKYYVQVLDQLQVCNCLVGYLVIYQPFFRKGGLKIIQFRAADLEQPIRKDLKTLNERKLEAVELFNNLRDQLLNS